jgi:hypothetical protein
MDVEKEKVPSEEAASPPPTALDDRSRFHRGLIVALMLLFIALPLLGIFWVLGR